MRSNKHSYTPSSYDIINALFVVFVIWLTAQTAGWSWRERQRE